MTSNCGHNARESRPARFLYNPLEIAFCGGAGDLMVKVWGALDGRFNIGTVIQPEPNPERLGDEPIGAALVHDGDRKTLMYPASSDAYLGPRSLLDADLVLIESREPVLAPKIVRVSDGHSGDWDDVVAYVAKAACCPVLPSDTDFFPDDHIDGIVDAVESYLEHCIDERPLFGLVLAGGFSTRMKHDKATLDYHGKPQAAYAYELLAGRCQQVYLSKRQYQCFENSLDDLPAIEDAFLGIGPMGGILTAQRAHPDAAWLVLACDLPFVDGPVLDRLIADRNPYKLATAYRSSHDGFPEPLCAIYEPKSVHRLLGFLGLGYQCPRKVLINSDTWVLEPSDPRALDNVNYPNEFESASETLQSDANART